MSFIKPALASPFTEAELPSGDWVVEEKFDGHRLQLHCGGEKGLVEAWSRDAKPRTLPPHLSWAAALLPEGVYDCELIVPAGHSSDVAELQKRDMQRLVVFDLLRFGTHDLTTEGLSWTFSDRRKALHDIFLELAREAPEAPPLWEASAAPVETYEAVLKEARRVWAREGEGLVLKELRGLYIPGKRLKTWLKLKKLESAVLLLVGFLPGLMGPRSVAVLKEVSSGQTTQVKWKSHAWLEDINAHGDTYIGRAVRIEFHERTRDGAFRHPRWDRWEDGE